MLCHIAMYNRGVEAFEALSVVHYLVQHTYFETYEIYQKVLQYSKIKIKLKNGT